MKFRFGTVLRFALVLASLPLFAAPARAATDCKDVPGIGPEIAKFLDEVAAAQAAGQGQLPLMDVLFGVTGIDAHDQKALDRRAPIEVTRRDAGGGDYANKGPKTITIEGIFAARETFFRIPPQVQGKYTIDAAGGVTLHYDPDYTVELGERHVGLRFFAPIHHTVITRDGLAFFLDQNAGPDPDRCYRATAG
ncbi:hypothetical protein [Dongia sedimenti]|uniref:Uncharacterized protein n=1 Tax=Dongia sedimenti TaxID=3064282 RepID=A0ABU0YUH4_9PROT|nr:hypothetical protein [Rhodospirillaceae bacterium R-7]